MVMAMSQYDTVTLSSKGKGEKSRTVDTPAKIRSNIKSQQPDSTELQ